MQVTGGQLSEELLDLLPDYELAWTHEGVGNSGGPDHASNPDAAQLPAPSAGGSAAHSGGVPIGGGRGGVEGFCAYYHTKSTSRLSGRYGDLLFKVRDMEVRQSAW